MTIFQTESFDYWNNKRYLSKTNKIFTEIKDYI